MTLKQIYLLVPVQGQSLKITAVEKIKVIGGRANAEREREVYERELNGGKTWKERLADCKSTEDFDALDKSAWVVHSDTYRNWSSHRTFDTWNIDERVDALLDQP